MDGLCRRLLLAVVCVMCSWEVVSAARWSHSAMLSPDYRLLWSLGPGPQDITFELQVKTLGYVGFGFSKDGRMAGADMVIGWVDHGQVYFQVRNIYIPRNCVLKQNAFRLSSFYYIAHKETFDRYEVPGAAGASNSNCGSELFSNCLLPLWRCQPVLVSNILNTPSVQSLFNVCSTSAHCFHKHTISVLREFFASFYLPPSCTYYGTYSRLRFNLGTLNNTAFREQMDHAAMLEEKCFKLN